MGGNGKDTIGREGKGREGKGKTGEENASGGDRRRERRENKGKRKGMGVIGREERGK